MPFNGCNFIRKTSFDKSHSIFQASVVISNPGSSDNLHPYDLALDPFSRHLYWTDALNNVINVTRMDAPHESIGIVMKGSHQKPRSIALAPEKGYVCKGAET